MTWLLIEVKQQNDVGKDEKAKILTQ